MLTQDLIKKFFFPSFDNHILSEFNDSGVFDLDLGKKFNRQKNNRIAICTDNHVVWPLFFRGGDIGRLAICGTVNDLAMVGAEPLYLTAGFILEEGLSIRTLESVIASMQVAAREAEISIIAGDTKVVEKGKADCIYINTSGFGVVRDTIDISGSNAKPGDKVIVSGTIGDHGIAVLEARGELGFVSDIQSDIAPLNDLVASILDVSKNIHCMRDPTRGGLATALNEIAKQSNVGIEIIEDLIPINPAVKSACEMLGFDPLYIANEGKMIVIVSPQDSDFVLNCMHSHKYGKDAAIIGEVTSEPPGKLLMSTSIGSKRVVTTLSGELLPRIC
jgi:hydrogenase expression/formation protein HypE